MKALLVATSSTPADALSASVTGMRQRIDYLELAQHVAGCHIDYNHIPAGPRLLQAGEQKLRLDVRQARYVAAAVRTARYDVVYSLSERIGIPLSLFLPANVHHVVQVHHLLSPAKLRLLNALHIPQRWHSIFVYTRREQAVLPGLLHLPSQRIHRLRDKVDTHFWQPSPPASCAGETVTAPYLWSIGASYRDYPTLIRALRQLPDIPARIHPGSSWVASDQRGQQEALPSNVRLSTQHLSPVSLREQYRACRLVVVPIRPTTLWNAGSNAVLEAQAMGKPVIATRTPGMTDYVRHGETGLLVEPGDPMALAAAIRELWHDPQRAMAMGRRAREWVESAYAFDTWLEEAATLIGSVR